ncbi:MAG: tolR protein [Bdellovibrio sp. CG10_big_fil_rev_8_21_14_0_10_47_8]|nr:MAG: tolR protein [Bdellovibrio sp. CG10_big_fil_rev_8_21_14_0_10_47_8]
MAHIDTGGGKGGRKVSLELNLVPFIDLMSVLITFLLITAVWSQVSMIQIGSSLYGKRSEQTPTPPPDADTVLKLDIRANGYLLSIGKQVINIPMAQSEYDDVGLVAQLEKAKQLYPNKVDAAIAMSDDLPYERLIRGMDVFLKAGFPQISVLTGGPN